MAACQGTVSGGRGGVREVVSSRRQEALDEKCGYTRCVLYGLRKEEAEGDQANLTSFKEGNDEVVAYIR